MMGVIDWRRLSASPLTAASMIESASICQTGASPSPPLGAQSSTRRLLGDAERSFVVLILRRTWTRLQNLNDKEMYHNHILHYKDSTASTKTHYFSIITAKKAKSKSPFSLLDDVTRPQGSPHLYTTSFCNSTTSLFT